MTHLRGAGGTTAGKGGRRQRELGWEVRRPLRGQGTEQAQTKNHANPTSCKAAPRHEKRAETRVPWVNWGDEVYDRVPQKDTGEMRKEKCGVCRRAAGCRAGRGGFKI